MTTVHGQKGKIMAEYIYEIEPYENDEYEVFIGWIRKHSQELVRCKDCKYSDTFSDMTAEPHSQLKCLGIRYGGVEPMWYCEHGKRKEE